MRNLLELNHFRIRTPQTAEIFGGTYGDESCGAFIIPSPIDQKPLKVLVTIDGDEGDVTLWEHISVSRQNRIPNWTEMDHIKRLIMLPHEVAFQIHPAVSEHVNIHNYCLHIWRPLNGSILLPPKRTV